MSFKLSLIWIWNPVILNQPYPAHSLSLFSHFEQHNCKFPFSLTLQLVLLGLYQTDRHLCSSTVLHYNTVLSLIWHWSKHSCFLWFGYYTEPYCDFDQILNNCVALMLCIKHVVCFNRIYQTKFSLLIKRFHRLWNLNQFVIINTRNQVTQEIRYHVYTQVTLIL